MRWLAPVALFTLGLVWMGLIGSRSSGFPVPHPGLSAPGAQVECCYLHGGAYAEVFRSPFFTVNASAELPPPGIPHRVRFRYREEVPGGLVASLVLRKAPGIEPGEEHSWNFSVETGFQVTHIAPRCAESVFIAGRDGEETVLEHWRIRPSRGMPSATAPVGRHTLTGRVEGGTYLRPQDRRTPEVEREELLRVPHGIDGLVADPGGEYLLVLVTDPGRLCSLDLASPGAGLQVIATAAERPELADSRRLLGFQTPWRGRGYRVLCRGGSLVFEGEGRGVSRVRFAGRWDEGGFDARYPRADWLTHRVETAWAFVW